MRHAAVISALLLAVFVAAASFFLVKDDASQKENTHVPEAKGSESTVYTKERYGFSLDPGPGVVIHERMEGPGSITISVEDAEADRGFQIFITPYAETTISDERFRMDIPSGVRLREEPLVLGGVQAVAFVSEDLRLGKTREVWLIHGGYLFEITSPLDDEQWLEGILHTLNFE